MPHVSLQVGPDGHLEVVNEALVLLLNHFIESVAERSEGLDFFLELLNGCVQARKLIVSREAEW